MALAGRDCAVKVVEYWPGTVPGGTRTCTTRLTCRPGVEVAASASRYNQSPKPLSVAEIAVLSLMAFEDCGEKTRILSAAASVPAPVQSENAIWKAFSAVGTVKCMVHCQPSAKVPSGVAVGRSAVMPVTASGTVEEAAAVENVMSEDDAIEYVVEAVVLASPDCTEKW